MGNTTTGRSELASIIVPCWNQLEFTRHCITALLRCTRRPWELILVNNGSTDGTRDYLAGVQDAAPVPVTVIRNPTNIGFPAAINQGLAQARGQYLVLLNNDAVVTEGWLEQLIALTRAESWPGAVEATGGAETTPVPSDGLAVDRALSTLPVPSDGLGVDGALSTPPLAPPLQGGESLVRCTG